MPAYPSHQDLRPFYVQSADPGAVGAGVAWVDTSSGPPHALKVRDGANSAWLAVGGGGGGGDAAYTHTQSVAATTWSITHGLGKHPAVMVVDSGDNVVFGDVHYVDANALTISFSAAFGGKAYLN